ncbi:MAG: sensor histidine kinase [Clostridia bacterium]|nr:sensor histidine kinase [Clostridia bacterium]
MKLKRPYSLRTQIFVYFLLTTGIIMIVMGLLLYANFSNLMEDEIMKSTRMGIDKSGRQLELYVKRVKDMSAILAGNVNTCSYFEHGNEGHEANEDDREDIDSLISAVLAGNEEIQTIVMVGYDGTVISNDPDLGMELSDDMMNMQWYKDALEYQMPVLTSARMQDFTMDKDQWVLSLSRDIIGECQDNIGVLLIDFRYDVIEDILYELDLGSKGYAFILNKNDEVVYHHNTSYFEDDEKREELVYLAKMGKNVMEADRLIHNYEIEGTDWILVGVASLDGVRAARNDIVVVLWIMGSALLIIALGSGFLFSNRVAKPLKRLEAAMEEVESGKLEQEVDIKGSSEAVSLAGHYSKMMVRVRDLLDEIQSKEKYLRTSEINTLQSQINPHFLYNTLDTIIWSAEFQESEKVITLTKALAKFFRLSLGDGSELTTVKDELDHVRQYLIIQKMRYEDKLNYEFSCSDGIYDIKIPKLILQPIVENAIYHGIRPKDGPGIVRIRAEKDSDGISFVISDDGIGYDPDSGKSSSYEGTGVGQRNVDQRIKLYYGEKYGLSVTSKSNEGTTVTVKIGTDFI